MSVSYNYLSTGLPELDGILKGLKPGDNVVWLINSIEEYKLFLHAYCENALRYDQKLIYFRFADHEFLLPPGINAEVHELDSDEGFEKFINTIHEVIEKNGNGGYYVFDSLTDLSYKWGSDQMLANFFMLTCPYLLDIEALAYFCLFRNRHSSHALSPISETAQIVIEVYEYGNDIYLHPVKVQHRYSPTMHMLHLWRDGKGTPVTDSFTSAEILTSTTWSGNRFGGMNRDIWSVTVLEGMRVLEQRKSPEEEKSEPVYRRLLRMVFSRDGKILSLAEKYISLGELVAIAGRMIGTGLIGGKSVGMLLARAIIRRESPECVNVLESHDSFYIGSDVFYTYLVLNGCWWVRQRKDLEVYVRNAMHARRLIHTGKFPDYIMQKLSDMLDYFGQSPIIVRSSSLLEDNFGNSFSGKYESVFCPNQGPREKCLKDLISAIKTIYASSISEKALRYRAACGMLEKDEQMPLLVQRVSGELHGNLFFPLVAGVGYSFNPFVWSDYIDPDAGVLRIVFGLGTRAVDRSDDDYTRIASLNAPERRPEENRSDYRKYSQRRVDVIDLDANQLVPVPFEEAGTRCPEQLLSVVAERDYDMERRAAEKNRTIFSYTVTFEKLFAETDFTAKMREMLKAIERAYGNPVDVEFTANFSDEKTYRINLVQCRPFQAKINVDIRKNQLGVDEGRAVLKSGGPVIGQSRNIRIGRIIYIDPDVYGQLNLNDKYYVARIIGKVMKHTHADDTLKTMLIGPGRWGTTTPFLGVPVSFNEISGATVLCEVVMMRDGLVPDVSLGTHFFNDLVDLDILYCALYPERESSVLDVSWLKGSANELARILPDDAKWSDAVRVIDHSHASEDAAFLFADNLNQEVILYLKKNDSPPVKKADTNCVCE